MNVPHFGDPCIGCGVPHDDVEPGACPQDAIVISRAKAEKLVGFLKNGRGPAGWPTPLWVEVQVFLATVENALSASPNTILTALSEASAREGVLEEGEALIGAALDDIEASLLPGVRGTAWRLAPSYSILNLSTAQHYRRARTALSQTTPIEEA